MLVGAILAFAAAAVSFFGLRGLDRPVERPRQDASDQAQQPPAVEEITV